MSKRARRLTLTLNSIFMLLLAVFATNSSAIAVNYYPDYTLSPSRTDSNLEIAFIVAAIGLLILAIDSFLYLGHFLWARRPASRKARMQRFSEEQS